MQRLKFFTICSVVSLLFGEYSGAMQIPNQRAESSSSISDLNTTCRWSDINDQTDLRQIKSLDARGCRLSSFPENLKSLINLQYLDLRDNELEFVPEFVKHLTNLEFIDLRNNKLSSNLEIIRNLEKLMASYSGNECEIINDLKNLMKTYSEKSSLKDILTLPKLKEIKFEGSLFRYGLFLQDLKLSAKKVTVLSDKEERTITINMSIKEDGAGNSVDNQQKKEEAEQNVRIISLLTQNVKPNYIVALYEYAQGNKTKLAFDFPENQNGLFNCIVKLGNKTFDYNLSCSSKLAAKMKSFENVYKYLMETSQVTENENLNMLLTQAMESDYITTLCQYAEGNKTKLAFDFSKSQDESFNCIVKLGNETFDYDDLSCSSKLEAKRKIFEYVCKYFLEKEQQETSQVTKNKNYLNMLYNYLHQKNKNSSELNFEFKRDALNRFKCKATLGDKVFVQDSFYDSPVEAENQISKCILEDLVGNTQDIDTVSTANYTKED